MEKSHTPLHPQSSFILLFGVGILVLIQERTGKTHGGEFCLDGIWNLDNRQGFWWLDLE